MNKKELSLIFLVLILSVFIHSSSITSSALATTTSSTTTSLPALTRNLSLGSTGEDVTLLQTWLKKDSSLYPEGLVTGYFGPATREAVKRFQSLKNIVSSGDEATTGYGSIGPSTRAILNQNIIGNNTLTNNTVPTTTATVPNPVTTTNTYLILTRNLVLGDQGEDVKALQTWLSKDKKIYPLGLVTGFFGPATREAVKMFQSKNNIVSSGTEETTGYGRIGPSTRAIINSKISSAAANAGVVSTPLVKVPSTATTSLLTSVSNILSNLVGGSGGGGGGGSSGGSGGGGSSGGGGGGVSLPILTHPDPSYAMPPHGVDETMTISQNSDDPVRFVTVDINPLVVYPGDKQTLKVTMASTNPITSVTAVTTLDSKTLTLNLADDGTGTNTWTTFWIVNDTIVQTYKTKFTATDNTGNSQSTNMAWSDPCSGWGNTNSALSSPCTIGTGVVEGVDGYNLTINSNQTLTLGTNSTLVFNPGTSITITKPGGSIAKGSGATIKKGYIMYTDGDGDGYPANTTTKIFSSTATASGYVRVTTAYSRAADPNDATSAIYQYLSCYVDADADGWTVGSPSSVASGASCPSSYVGTSLGTDCNDANSGLTNNCCVGNMGATCYSNYNSCSQRNTGSIQCNGTCSVSATAPANPAYYGQACTGATSVANNCGGTNAGGAGTFGCAGNNSTANCSGATGSTPANVAGIGNACYSNYNSCGVRNTGSLICNGGFASQCSVSATAPACNCQTTCQTWNSCGTSYNSGYTNACGAGCDAGAPANPYTVGGACTTTNTCGSASGTWQNACSGNCSGNPTSSRTRYADGHPACGSSCTSESQSCSNGAWNGSGWTATTCLVEPASYSVGAQCARNVCDTATITDACSGSCSYSPAPTVPGNYNTSCGSCGGTINCAGSCSVSTPWNFGATCNGCGTIQCDGSCDIGSPSQCCPDGQIYC